MPIDDVQTLSERLGKLCDNLLYYWPNEVEPRNQELQRPCYVGGANFVRLLLSVPPVLFNNVAINFPREDNSAQGHYIKGATDFLKLMITAKPQEAKAFAEGFPTGDEEAGNAYLSAIRAILTNLVEWGITPGPDERARQI